jgi:Ca-activated chloride channel homolog
MNFLAPAAFALALLIPLIIAMYLLKLRRTEQVIASVYLWRRMVRDVEANAPWQRLRKNLLLLLQLLFVALLVFALSRPFTWTEGIGGQSAVFVVDTSASMAATDGSPTRLAEAKGQMLSLIDGLPSGARVTIIEAGPSVRIAAASTQDRRQLRTAIDELHPRSGGSALASALDLAAAVAARQTDAEIVVLSDFAGTGPVDELSARVPASTPVRYVTLGERSDNAAISALSLQSAAEGGVTAFVQVANYGEEAMPRRLLLSIIEDADGSGATNQRLFGAYDLVIPPQGQEIVVVDDLPVTVTVLEAALAGADALPLDDRAWAVLRNSEAAQVTLVSTGNRFLETALALLPILEVTTMRPADYESMAAATPALTILDSYVPVTGTLPAGNLLFIAPLRSTGLFSVTGVVEEPIPLAVDRADPLLAHVNLGDVGVLKAARIPTPLWAREVVVDGAGAEGFPLLFAGEQDGRRIAVLTFDLRESDLPLQVAFPLLMANLTTWLAAHGSGQAPPLLAPGDPLLLTTPPAVESVTITRPGGATSQLIPERGRIRFAETESLGLYQIAWNGRVQAHFAVNLSAPQESTVKPRQLFGSAEAAAASVGSTQQSMQEWWRLLAFAALALLMAEWLVYQRGTVVRLWNGIFGR